MPLFTRVRSWYQKAAAPNSDLSSILDTTQEKVSESGFAGMPSYTVCIVEDNAECAAAFIDKVAASPFSEGFEVHEMASRAELEYFVSEGHAVDILITDINLGTDAADGISMVRDLFPAGSKTQVIYATGYIEYCTPVYETQHVYFLVKPVRQSAFDDALKKALENLAGQNVQDGQTEQVGRGAHTDVPPRSRSPAHSRSMCVVGRLWSTPIASSIWKASAASCGCTPTAVLWKCTARSQMLRPCCPKDSCDAIRASW